MTRNEEFLQILRVLLSQQPSGEPSLPEAGVEGAVQSDAAPTTQSAAKKCRGARS